MIDSWTLARFKSVYDKTTLELGPLTVFAGTNNSGKSTVIQSILLTAQSLQSPVFHRPITLNGHLVRLGTFDDILSSGVQDSTIELGFSFSDFSRRLLRIPSPPAGLAGPYWRNVPEDIERVQCDFRFSPSGGGERKEILQLQPSLDRSKVEVEYRVQNPGATPDPSEQLRKDIIEIVHSSDDLQQKVSALGLTQIRPDDLRALEYRVAKGEFHQAPRYGTPFAPHEIIGASMYHFLPRALLAKYDEVEELARQTIAAFSTAYEYPYRGYRAGEEGASPKIPEEFRDRVLKICQQIASELVGRQAFAARNSVQRLEALSSEFTPANFRTFAVSLPPAQRTVLVQKIAEESAPLERILRGNRQPVYRTTFLPVSEQLDSVSSFIFDYFQRFVKYLAPLRDEPKPVYPLSGITDPFDVGLKGEHTAAVLETNKTQSVEYVPPQLFEGPLDSVRPVTDTLQSAVMAWMRYMGVVTEVDTFDRGKLGHELKVSIDQEHHLRDLTHVGVGVSQVLPIVVLALLAPPGSTLIFEQPELHLHPRVQSRLADFFVSMTLLSKQCIVETHSEHIINRLRFRVADAKSEDLSKDIIVYFVEAINGRSKYRKLNVNRYGAMSEWPKGFFDESEELATALLKAGIEKRSLALRQ